MFAAWSAGKSWVTSHSNTVVNGQHVCLHARTKQPHLGRYDLWSTGSEIVVIWHKLRACHGKTRVLSWRRSAEGGGQIEVPVIPAVTLPPVGVSMYIAHCSRQGRLPTPRGSQVTHRHARVCACSHETKTRLEPAKYHLS